MSMSRWDAAKDITDTSTRAHLHWLAGRLAVMSRHQPSSRRDPEPGEVCLCGKPAATVVKSDYWGEVPTCAS